MTAFDGGPQHWKPTEIGHGTPTDGKGYRDSVSCPVLLSCERWR